jgi:cation diffusion facilitator family transporter
LPFVFLHPLKKSNSIFRLQFWVLLIGIFLMIVKFIAHVLTQSNAILSDALESIINVAAGGFALFSLWLSQKPKDLNHPYGHGKIEFVSTGFEGGMIVLAAFYILFEAIHSFFLPVSIQKLDTGIYLIAITGLVNFIMGTLLVQTGTKNRSHAMIADGKHLLTDTYSTLGLIVGLVLVSFTGFLWLDGVIAIVMGLFILYTGLKLIRKALAGLMDEADDEIINELVPVLNQNRKPEWIDIHNLRVVKYGSSFHIDAHVTLPWYWNLEEVHDALKGMDEIVSQKFHHEIELFIHPDPCLPLSCKICEIHSCSERKQEFVHRTDLTFENIQKNEKHTH